MFDELFAEFTELFTNVFRDLDIMAYLDGVNVMLGGGFCAQIIVNTLVMVVCTIPFAVLLKLIDFVCGGYKR